MTIRAAVASDLPAFQQIAADAYGKYTARIGKPAGPMLADYRACIADRSAWVDEVDGTVAGFIVLLAAADHLLLDNVAIVPSLHGRGIGHALMAFAEHEARRLGYRELRLYTHAAMTENIAMYRALGWRETGRGEQDGYSRVFFSKAV